MRNSTRIVNMPAPVDTTECDTKAYCDLKILKSGGTMTGSLFFEGSTRNLTVGCNN